MNKLFLIPFFIVFIHLYVSGQQRQQLKLTKHSLQKIDALFSKFNETSPGFAIGIIKGRESSFTKGYGSSNLDYSLPITASTAFDIASVSKQFTGAAIALLILDNKLTLETAAADFIPALNKYRDTIKIKHLLYNSSGITDYYRLQRSSGKSWIPFNYFDIDECINTSLAKDSLAFTPGSQWDYCNVNFMLLAKIVEKISGRTLNDYLKQNLFLPAKMNNTFINDDITRVIKNRATPYNKRTAENIRRYINNGVKVESNGEWIQHPRTSPHYGGSGVVSTAEDILKWSAYMFLGAQDSTPLYKLLHDTMKFDHDRSNQAMGLYHGNYKGRNFVAWDGGDWGISSQLIRFPNEKVAVVVLSNFGEGEAYRKAYQIADILIEAGAL